MSCHLRFILVSVLITSICGCGGNRRPDTGNSFGSSDGLQKYLKNEPSVKAVQSWPNKFGDGLLIRTAHYEIYTTLKEPLMLRQVPGLMESAYKAYQNQLTEKIETTTPFIVYLFADRAQWDEFTKDFAGRDSVIYLKIDRGAYYLNGSCVAYNIGRQQTFSALAHEAWHQFSSRHFRYRLPSWLDEGIAMQYETPRQKNGFFEFVPEMNYNRIGTLKLAMADRKILPIQTMITLNPGQVIMNGDTKDTIYFYAQAYATVRFLRESNYGKRQIKYNNMLLGGLHGSWPLDEDASKLAADRNIPMTAWNNAGISSAIFQYYIGSDFEAMDREFMAFSIKITKGISVKVKK